MPHIVTKYLTLCLLLPMAAMAKGADVDSLLNRFDQVSRVETANEFFKNLKTEDFTDSLICFKSDVAREILQGQVWYWAAEWYYDQQLYDKALAYGQKAQTCFAGGVILTRNKKETS